MALYSDRYFNDPDCRAYEQIVGRAEAAYHDEMAATASTIDADAERVISKARMNRDAALARRGLAVAETELGDGSFWVDIIGELVALKPGARNQYGDYHIEKSKDRAQCGKKTATRRNVVMCFDWELRTLPASYRLCADCLAVYERVHS